MNRRKGQKRRENGGDEAVHEEEMARSTATPPTWKGDFPTATAASSNTTSEASTPDGEPSMPRQIILERAKRPKLGTKGRYSSYTVRAPGTPFHELDLSEIPWLRHEVADGDMKRGITRYRRLFFLAGIMAGAVLAWAFGHHVLLESRIQHLRGVIDDQLVNMGLNMSNLDLSFSMPQELVSLSNDLFTSPKKWTEQRDFSVGIRLRDQERIRREHPVILLPGIVSTALESWSTDAGSFRKKLWGGVSMIRTIATQKEMWIKQLSLDPNTGLDPPGIKVRAAEGLDAASYFVSGYWIWARIIENLAAIGYDTNDLWLASYDWRLSYPNLEHRDRFFSRMKFRFEQNLFLTGKKSVLVSHSMGSSVALHFFKWVEAEGPNFGNGGPDWVEKHIESFVSIAGTFLGVPKAMAALLSGEMRDTAELPPPAAYLLEKLFSRKERVKLFRTWAGSASMMIKGGDAIWGNMSWAPDDEEDTGSAADDSHGKLYSFKLPEKPPPHLGAGDAASAAHEDADGTSLHDLSSHHTLPKNLSANHAFTWLLQHAPSSFQQMVEETYSNGMEFSEEKVKANNQNEKTWANPLEAALPNAPSMKMHCIYGVGKPTERSYWYAQGPYERDEFMAEDSSTAKCLDCGNQTLDTPLGFPLSRTGWIDTSVHDEKSSPMIRSGVKFSDGDGTVSAHSLGAMCLEGWKQKRYNPGNIKVFTHEIAHEPELLDLRGGKTTGDHVDILGSYPVNEIVLRVAAGQGHTVNETYFSKAREWAKRVNWTGEHDYHRTL